MTSEDDPPHYKAIGDEDFVDVMAFNSVISEFKNMVELEFSEIKKHENRMLNEVDAWFAMESKKLESERNKRKCEIRKKMMSDMNSKSQNYRMTLRAFKKDNGWIKWIIKQIGV